MVLFNFNLSNPPYQTNVIDKSGKLTTYWLRWLTQTIKELSSGIEISIDDLSDEIVNVLTQINFDTFNLENLKIQIEQSISNFIQNNVNQYSTDLFNDFNNCNDIVVGAQQIINDLSNIDNFNTSNAEYINSIVYNNSTVSAILITTTDLTLDASHHHVLVDASSAARNITLPNATLHTGREFVVHGYNATNTITVLTTSSQQIRRISSDTATSDNIMSGDAIYYISTGSFWKVA